MHPRVITEGFDQAKNKALEILENIKVPIEVTKENLMHVARTALRTKLHPVLADVLTEVCRYLIFLIVNFLYEFVLKNFALFQVCVDAVLAIYSPDQEIDLHMVELMEMQHKIATETSLIKGLVLDHGSRHPDMPKKLENAYILTCNVSLEYEKR